MDVSRDRSVDAESDQTGADWRRGEISRRSALTLLGASTVAAWTATSGTAAAAEPPAQPSTPVTVLINGTAAQVGTYAFPDEVDALVLDNDLIRFTFGRDDAPAVMRDVAAEL